jgi:hypothetical protein
VTKTFRDLGVAAPCVTPSNDSRHHPPLPHPGADPPPALAGNDLIGQARTGTGKTLAFGLPLLQRIDPEPPVTQALVVVPTRELCLQVHNDLRSAPARSELHQRVRRRRLRRADRRARGRRPRGGRHPRPPARPPQPRHARPVAGDRARARRGRRDARHGLPARRRAPDRGLHAEGRHTMLFSATMPTAIVKLGRRYMHQPTFTRADRVRRSTPHRPSSSTSSRCTGWTSRACSPGSCRRPSARASSCSCAPSTWPTGSSNELEELATPAIAIHGDLRQATRERNLDRFRSGKATVLVATEVAARGPRRHRRHPRRQLRLPRRRQDVPAPHRPHGPRGPGPGSR